MKICPQCGTHYDDVVGICPADGTVLETGVADANVGRVLDGKYRLDARVGEGGMGAIYRAHHLMLDRTVAVKLINPELVSSPDIVRRFQREARAVGTLTHPNIVAAYDLGQTTDGTLYIAMEFVQGTDLKEIIRAGGPMKPARVVDLLRQVAGALSVAHAQQVIHRDLKPQNIMVAVDWSGHEVAKLLDFGIAKTFSETSTRLTRTGAAIGTPQDMAPEQAHGVEVDARTDLYAMGVILYEMLVGEVPFDGASTPSVLLKLVRDAPVPPSQRRPELHIPPALEAVALKCLEKSPADRFQTADEFAAALAAAATERPVAPPVTAPPVAAPPVAAPPVVAPPPGRRRTLPAFIAAGLAVAAIVASQLLPAAQSGGVRLRLAVNTAQAPPSAGNIEAFVTRTVEVIRKRLSDLGVRDAAITPDPANPGSIVLDLRGTGDLSRAKMLILSDARLELKLVEAGPEADESTLLQPHGGATPAGLDVVSAAAAPGGAETWYLVRHEPVVAGSDVRKAQATLDQFNQPAIGFTLSAEAATKFTAITQANVGRMLAILLDGRVMSAPRIEGAIGAEGQITGSFTQQEAQDLALVLRSGGLPAPLTFLEESALAPVSGAGWARALVLAAGAVLVVVSLVLLVVSRG